jgi:hypothetical protein
MKDNQSRHIAWRLYELIAPLKGWVFFSIVCMVGYNIFTAAPAYYAKDIVDAIAYGDNPELKQYFLVGLGMMIVFAIKGLFFFWSQLQCRTPCTEPHCKTQAAAF